MNTNKRNQSFHAHSNQKPKVIKAFYNSSAWKRMRQMVMSERGYLCEWCLKDGEHVAGIEVHHITPITVDNVRNPSITLNKDNLVLLCKACHNKAHKRFQGGSVSTKPALRKGLMFDEFGDVIQIPDDEEDDEAQSTDN